MTSADPGSGDDLDSNYRTNKGEVMLLFATLFTLNVAFAAEICSDGWVSGSGGSGTCSHHGGIAKYPQYVGVTRGTSDGDSCKSLEIKAEQLYSDDYISDSEIAAVRLRLKEYSACYDNRYYGCSYEERKRILEEYVGLLSAREKQDPNNWACTLVIYKNSVKIYDSDRDNLGAYYRKTRKSRSCLIEFAGAKQVFIKKYLGQGLPIKAAEEMAITDSSSGHCITSVMSDQIIKITTYICSVE